MDTYDVAERRASALACRLLAEGNDAGSMADAFATTAAARNRSVGLAVPSKKE